MFLNPVSFPKEFYETLNCLLWKMWWKSIKLNITTTIGSSVVLIFPNMDMVMWLTFIYIKFQYFYKYALKDCNIKKSFIA